MEVLTKYDIEIKSNIASLLGKRCRFEMMKKQEKDKEIVVTQLENTREVPQILIQEELEMKYQGITIHKNKTCDTWYTRYRVGGKQYYISARTQKECLEKLKKELYKKQREYFMSKSEENRNKSITLLEWYNKWLNLYKVGKVKDNTLRDYTSMLKLIPTQIQNKALSEIKLSEIITILNSCTAERQKQKLYDFINVLYKKAVDNDIIEKNIVVKIDKPKHVKNHGQALDNAQQTHLIEICKQIPNADFMLVAMYQGLRRGEVLGLTIDNIDFEKNTLTINKAWNDKNQFDTTKNKQSIRTMPLFAETKKILLKYKNKKERIFELSKRQYEKVIIKIKEKSAIPDLKLKDMRSTFITRCKELNIPLHIIQSWVGHIIGSTVTNLVYTKHNVDADTKYINILNESKFYSNSTQILLTNKNDP